MLFPFFIVYKTGRKGLQRPQVQNAEIAGYKI